jgi:hypothetical protein
MLRNHIHRIVDDLFDLGQELLAPRRPPAACRHFRAAGREVLLGVRAAVDLALDRLEAAEAGEPFVPVAVDE